MRVRVSALGVVAGEALAGFQPREELPNRKHLKLMSRPVQLGVAAIGRALAARPGWQEIAPERRGLYVGTTPVGADLEAILPALRSSSVDGRFDSAAFGAVASAQVPPLWLVQGLSNNINGFATSYHDLRGANGNRCEGRVGGLAAVVEGARAIASGRADLVVAGGADCLVGAEEIIGVAGGEGAAFVVLEPATDGDEAVLVGGGVAIDPSSAPEALPGDLGAASGPVELATRLAAGERDFTVTVRDPIGFVAWVRVG